MKIAIATGTRADWGLLSPLAEELKRRGMNPTILATNAHLRLNMGMTVQEIENDGFSPVTLPADGTPSDICGEATVAFGKYFAEHKPDVVIILGDRFEMLGVAAAALLNHIEIIHIAGGTVSEGAYDNEIRNAISKMASLHLVETPQCAKRLQKMDIAADKISTVGALGVYNSLNIPAMTRKELEKSIDFQLPRRFLLVTLHAATRDNASPLQRMKSLTTALTDFLRSHKDYGVLFTYPNNDTDPVPQIKEMECFRDLFPQRVVIIPSLGRLRYISAVREADAVVGNSSSGIVEVASTGTPVLDIGMRQRGRERGPGVTWCEADAESILAGLEYVTSPEFKAIAAGKENPYYREDTPRIMADEILKFK